MEHLTWGTIVEVIDGPGNGMEKDGLYVLKIRRNVDNIIRWGVYSGSPANGWFGGYEFPSMLAALRAKVQLIQRLKIYR